MSTKANAHGGGVLKPKVKPVYNDRDAKVQQKKKKKKNSKHDSIIPDVIVEKRKSSSGEVKIYKYTKGKYLGKGGFARCYTMTCMKTGRVYAGKVVAKSSLVKSKAKAKLIAEIKIHKHLNHRHIVKFEHFFEDKVNVYILLEICTNSTMMESVKRRKTLSEPEARYYTLQMIDALRYLHRHKVIHRDMKLGNLFLNKNMEVRVGDLGLSAKLVDADERKKTICGTPNYIAPEIIAGHSHSFEVDVWSLGVIMFTMLFGKPPFETKDVKSTYKKIKHVDYKFPGHVNVSNEAKSLVKSILQLTPGQRPTLDQILCHEWFTGYSAVIPKMLPVSALHMEPNFYDIERSNAGNENRASSDGKEVRLSRDSGGRRPLGQHNENNKADKAARDGERRASRKSSTRPSSAAPSRKSSSKHSSGQYRPSSASSSRPVKDGSQGSGRGVKAPVVSSTMAWEAKKAKDGILVPSQVSPKGNYDEVPQVSAAGTGETSASTKDLAPATGGASPRSNKAKKGEKNKNRNSNTARSLGTLKNMHLQLTRSFAMASGETTKTENFEDALCKETAGMNLNATPSVWVNRWVDYTSKYGLGYMLANGSIGVYFNDSTKIILSSDNDTFEYMERTSQRAARQAHLVGLSSPEPQRFTHRLSDFPVSLNKKVTLLKHFKSYLHGQEDNRSSPVSGEEKEVRAFGSGDRDMIYVKKWVKTRHAILFRMSNRTVQVAFFDETEIILASQAKLVTYVDKEGKRSTHSLYDITRSKRTDISKRLKYTKDILQQLISGKRSSS